MSEPTKDGKMPFWYACLLFVLVSLVFMLAREVVEWLEELWGTDQLDPNILEALKKRN